MILCILIPLITGVICGILGYLIGRMNSNSENNNADYIKRISALERDLEQCRNSKVVAPKISGNESMSFASTAKMPAVAAVAFNADLAKSALGKKINEDDLTVVEGIGPKISELFNSNGVATWKALAECSVDKCQTILNLGGKRFEIHKPGTWPEQAKMAAEGKWAELKIWQDKLDGGK